MSKKFLTGMRKLTLRLSSMSPTAFMILTYQTFTGKYKFFSNYVCLLAGQKEVLKYNEETIEQHVIFFVRYIVGYKNLLKAVEFSGRSGILSLEYLSSAQLDEEKYEKLIQTDSLRREYLNQTVNFLPFLQVIF